MPFFLDHQVQALPPQYQEMREKEAILNDPRLQEWLGGAELHSIVKIEGESAYLVTAEIGTLRVEVHYIIPEQFICGPAQFELVFGSNPEGEEGPSES